MMLGIRLASRITGLSPFARRYASFSSVAAAVTPIRYQFPRGNTALLPFPSSSGHVHRAPSTTPSISELITGIREIPMSDPVVSSVETLQMDSVKRKRKKMMKKHKLRKRRKAQRALKIRLKK